MTDAADAYNAASNVAEKSRIRAVKVKVRSNRTLHCGINLDKRIKSKTVFFLFYQLNYRTLCPGRTRTANTGFCRPK